MQVAGWSTSLHDASMQLRYAEEPTSDRYLRPSATETAQHAAERACWAGATVGRAVGARGQGQGAGRELGIETLSERGLTGETGHTPLLVESRAARSSVSGSCLCPRSRPAAWPKSTFRVSAPLPTLQSSPSVGAASQRPVQNTAGPRLVRQTTVLSRRQDAGNHFSSSAARQPREPERRSIGARPNSQGSI